MRRFGLLFVLLLSACAATPPDSQTDFNLTDFLGGGSGAGFAQALDIREFRFPEDHGAHPAFRSEWWYLTGNLRTETGRRFGFQATFFRLALSPIEQSRKSRWASNQVYMAHAALSDEQAKNHISEERFSRGAMGLAGARLDPFRVWLGEWQLGGDDSTFPWRLHLPATKFELSLELDPLRAPVLQGDRGLSRKSSEPGNASYYYSITRMDTKGVIKAAGESFQVRGLSWLDREWSTSALAKDQIGWDWFSLQLLDGSDLMYYRLRKGDGSTDPHSGGSFVDPSGEVHSLRANAVGLTPREWWTNSRGVDYPVGWTMHIKDLEKVLYITPALENQEMRTSFSYWEGAVDVLAADSGKIVGQGYLEMTGYDKK